MSKVKGMFPRLLAAHIRALLRDELVIIVEGPRSVGKSTIVSEFAKGAGVDVINLEDANVEKAVRNDPAFFVGGSPLVIIDEYQKVPALLAAIKTRLSDPDAGQFLLTGSSRHDYLRGVEALTGRIHLTKAWPLSQLEMADGGASLLPLLLEGGAPAVRTRRMSNTSREEYIGRVAGGGFPIAIGRSGVARSRWFDDYVRTSLQRDVLDLRRVDKPESLAALLNVLASSTGQPIQFQTISRILGQGFGEAATNKTVAGYTALLEAIFLVQRLPAWGTHARSAEKKLDKLHVVDSGVATHLLRLNEARLLKGYAQADTTFGQLLETFVVGEIRAQTSVLENAVRLHHWRVDDTLEVDLVIELDDGSIIGVEVKASPGVDRSDWAGLRSLEKHAPDRFRAGILLNLGSTTHKLNDRIATAPIDALWNHS